MTEMLTRKEFEKVERIVEEAGLAKRCAYYGSEFITALKDHTEPEPVVCPLCGEEMKLTSYGVDGWDATCMNEECLFTNTAGCLPKSDLIRKLKEARRD
jgi:hypothetical protein